MVDPPNSSRAFTNLWSLATAEREPKSISKATSATPTIRIAPPYPEACASKGIEGVVQVQFDVTAEGEVTNVVILSAPDRCFHRAVLKAVSGWKYSPDMRDGRAAMRRGVRETFVFELTE
ncbi:MAG: energy transducer TonB [Rhodospirillales bacterium]|nr:energy transducer TonB [Rhodospirillales bacterium]